MPDLTFNLEKVLDSYRYKAARACVFTPLLGNTWFRDGNEGIARIDEAIGKVQRMWRHRLVELRAAGNWKALAPKQALQYMRNCPPFGVVTTDRAYACDRGLICPFCYARNYAIKAFKQVEDFLYWDGETHMHKPRRVDGTLVAFSISRRFSLHKQPFTAKALLTCWCPRLRVHINKTRKREVDLGAAVRAMVMHRIEPEDDCLRVTRSGLMYVKRVLPRSFLESEKDRLEVIAQPSKKVLYEVFPHLFRYPESMLKCPPEIAAGILTGMHRFCLFSTYGCWAPGSY